MKQAKSKIINRIAHKTLDISFRP